MERILDCRGWAGPAEPAWAPTTPCYGSEAYGRNWRAYEAASSLACGDYEPGSMREWELRQDAA